MSIKYQGEAKILTAESKPYEIGGNSGVSHRVRVSVDGEIYPCKSDEAQVKDLIKRELVGKDCEVEIEVQSRKENLSVKLVSAV